ncbi:hypothetical protein BCR36DRAFT_321885, partial [Piromyces finnis]
MLGPSAEESEMLVMEHLHYLERLAKFSLDLNIYNIPIVQETFQKLVSITGTRRFFQRAEAFERFLSMLSRRTLNPNYYLNRQHFEEINAYNNSNVYGYANYNQEYANRVQAVNFENVNAYYREYNQRLLNGNILSMNNMNRYYQQTYYNQRDILQNNGLDDIDEEESVEEEEEEIENDETIEQDENITNHSFNSENSSPIISNSSSLREDYTLYAPSAHYRRRRSRAPSYESYINRIHYPDFRRVQSSLSEISTSVPQNMDTKNNDTLYPENNSETTNNIISNITTFDNNNNNKSIENIHNDSTNDSLQMNKELKYNTLSYRNINMKLYDNLNILTPPSVDNDAKIKKEKESGDEKMNNKSSQDTNITNSESQSILIIPNVELESFDKKYHNIPKEEINNLKDSSKNNTINKKSENCINIKAEDYQTKTIYNKDN